MRIPNFLTILALTLTVTVFPAAAKGKKDNKTDWSRHTEAEAKRRTQREWGDRDAVQYRSRTEREKWSRDQRRELGIPRDTQGHQPHDRNGDGVISRAEWPGNDTSFAQLDRNRDGVITDADRKLDRRKRSGWQRK